METRWKNEGVKQIVGKDSRYKLFWSGNDNATGGVGVLLAEEWWEKVFEVVRVSDRIILIRMTIGKTVFVFVCVYAPQANLSEFEKDRFYQMLQCTVAKIPASEQLFVCGDWNGHLGSQSTGFEEVQVIKNDRKKLDMDSADPQNRSEWRGRLQGRLALGRGKLALKRI